MLCGYENGEKYCFDSRLNEISSVHLERLWQSICDNIKQIFIYKYYPFKFKST